MLTEGRSVICDPRSSRTCFIVSCSSAGEKGLRTTTLDGSIGAADAPVIKMTSN